MNRTDAEHCHGQPTTFAQLLQQQLAKRSERLSLPAWIDFPHLQRRKDQAQLTDTERSRFTCAINMLIADGTFGQFVAIHGEMSHMMHSSPRFLPWHRVYLRQLELIIQASHPDVTIPYWDCTQAGEEGIPPWLVSFTPIVPMPDSAPIETTRAAGTPADLATIASNIPSIMNATTFDDFWAPLESVHGAVHVWVGGSMGSIPTAPADPIFWMHHANIDRLWWLWQKTNPGINPDLSEWSSVMDPWPASEVDTRDIEAMGYRYAS